MLSQETTTEPQIIRFENRTRISPVFSICIPQYNRTSFILKSLQSFQRQTFQNIEICISDGGSNDGRYEEIVGFLFNSHLSFCFIRHEWNLRYDENLRASMALAQGRYCLLCGNDDMLAGPAALESLQQKLEIHGFPEVVITNYRELSTGNTYRRITETRLIGSGPFVAAGNFRNFSFVSGILLDRTLAQKHATDDWDGSEMYQMFIGSRIIAEGGRLFGFDDVIVLKDLQIPNESVDSYARKPVVAKCRIQQRWLPMCLYPRVAFAAVAPFLNAQDNARVLRGIVAQVLMFTYPPWLVEYRRVQSWRYAAGVALAMRPRNLLTGLEVDWWTNIYVRALHILGTMAGLSVPRKLYGWTRKTLYTIAKRNT